MGRPKGKWNRAKEKVWPGQDAAIVRAEKHGAVAQMEEQSRGMESLSVSALRASENDVGSNPTSSITTKALRKIRPETELARLSAKAKAEGTEVPYARRRRLPSIHRVGRGIAASVKTAADVKARQELYWLLENKYKESKTDFFKMIARLDGTVEYALPEMWHECDPSELMDIFDNIEWHRFALAMGYSELDIKNNARA